MPQERAMTKRESFEELVREGLITLPRREERRPALSDDEWAARKASYDELVRDGLISDGRSGGIAPVVGAFVGNAMDAAADAVLGVPDVAIDYIGRALMPDNPEASPIRAAVAEGIQRYNPAGMLRDYAKEQSAPMLADVPQKQYDPNAGILDYVFDPYVLAGGLGSMVGYMGSAAASPVGLAGRALSRLPQAARIMNGMTGRALTAMRGGASEGLVEGVNVYDDVSDRGGNPNEAIAAALKTAGLNIPIDMLTNYLGFAAENKLTKGAIAATLNRLTGGRLSAAAIERGANIISQGLSGTLSEGGQETLQSTVSKKYGEGRTWGDVLSPEALRETFVTEGLPGAVVGGVTGGAFGSLAPVRNAEEQGTRSAQTAQPETPSVLSQPQASDAQEAETLAQSQAGQIDETGPQSGANTNAGAAVSAPSGDVDAFIDGVVGEVNAASEGAAANPEAVSEGNAAVVAEAVNAASTGASEQTRTREPIAQGTPQPDGTVTLKSGGQAVAQPPAQTAANPPSRSMVRYRSNGQLLETPVDYALMEMDDLITSNTDSGGVNEAYPAEFQPRDRSRASGMLQVAQMANDLRPELLGADEYADRGAPIIDVRGNVISGNGRTMSIRSAYRNMPDTSGARYRNWLAENAASLGLDGAAVSNMRNPVLVRRLTDPELDLRTFAEDANTPVVAGMSASEQAMRDAERLTPEVLAKFVPNDMGDVLTNNGEFVQAFGEMIPPSERERFINREGRLSQDGARRIKNALVAKAYGDAGFLERVSESTDDDMRNLSNALTQAAPAIATAEERMSRGLLDSNLSLRAPLIEAVHELERVREQGGNVAEVLNQQGLFGGQLSDEAKILLQFFDANKRSAKAIRTLLTDYAAAVEEKGDPRQANMFDTESETAAQLLTRMAAKHGKGADGRSIVPSERNQGRIDFSAAEQSAQQVEPKTDAVQTPNAQIDATVNAQQRGDRIHEVATALGVDENALRSMAEMGLTDANINEFGRFDNLKGTIDREKARTYFQSLTGGELPPHRSLQRADALLRDVIINGGGEGGRTNASRSATAAEQGSSVTESVEYSADEADDGSFTVSRNTVTRDESGNIVSSRREVVESGLDEREADEMRGRLQTDAGTGPGGTPAAQRSERQTSDETPQSQEQQTSVMPSASATPQMRLAARANGTLDTGTRTLRADSLAVAEDSIVYKNGGIETRYVKLDAGYKQSPRAFDSRAESGFIGYYHQKKAAGGKGRVVQVYEKASETDPRTGVILKTYSLRGVDPSFSATVNERTLDNAERYEKLSKSAAEKLWDEESRILPRMRHETRHLLSGAILPIYNSVEMGEGGGSVLKAPLDDGRSILGLAVSEQRIAPTLRNLASMPDNAAPRREGQTVTEPQDVMEDIMSNGTEYRLQNDWRLKRSRVLGENRLELVGPDFTQERALRMWGVIKETIASRPRYFIPTGQTTALSMVLRMSPIDSERTVRNSDSGEARYRIADIRQRDAALKNEMLRGRPVARVVGNEFQNVRSSDELVNDLYRYYGENYGGKVNRPGIGDIYFTKKGLRSDVGHGFGREKISAFAAVPDILTKGKVLRISPNWKGRGYRSFVIGAPIEIAGRRYLAFAVVNEVTEKNRSTTHGNFYLHEVFLQDIPPDASEVPDQQAYRDAGVVHAATKAGEAAHVHRSSDGPIAASAEAVQLPRGDSSSNEGLPNAQTTSSRGTQQPSPLRSNHRSSAASDVSQYGDIYTLLNMVINVNSLPEITPEAINANAPGLKATKLSGGALLLEGKGGVKIFVDNRDEPLDINSAAFRQEYGREVTPDDIATGRTRIMDKKAFIDLVNGVSTDEDFNEELYHVAENLVLRPEEITKLEEDYGTEKARVEAYLNFRSNRIRRLTVRSTRFFQRIKDCFGRIRAKLFGPRSEDIFRDIADGRVWDREVLASNEAVERYRANKKTPYEAVFQDGSFYAEISSDNLEVVESIAQKFNASRRENISNEQAASTEVPVQNLTGATVSSESIGNDSEPQLGQNRLFEESKKFSKESKDAKKEATVSMPATTGKVLEDVVSAEDGKRPEGMTDIPRSTKRRMTFKERLDAAYTAHIDDLHPIFTHFGRDMYRRAANALYGIGSKAQFRLLHGDPEHGVKGLKEIWDMLPAEHRSGFSYYAVLKHLYDIAKLTADAREQAAGLQQQLDEGGLDAKERARVEAQIAELKKRERFTKAGPEVYEAAVKKIEAAFPKWVEAQKELVKYNRALLKTLEDSGIISHELYYDLIRRYPNYVPLQRDFGTEEGLNKFVEGRGLVNVENPLKRLRGSERDVIDPLDQIIRNTYAFESVAARQGVAREIVRRYDKGEYDGLMEQVEDRHHGPGESIFYVYENGKKRLFKTDKDIYEALTRSVGAAPQETNIFTKMLSAPTRALRYGTTHSLTFGVGNLLRDTFSYAVLGKDFRPVVDTVNGFMALLTDEALVRDFMRNGGLQESSWLTDDKREEIIRLLKGRKTWKDNAALQYNPISLYFKLSGAFAEFSEQASRLGQYKRLLEKGYSKEDAVFETRDNMNFMRAGTMGRSINRFVPFYNAGLQGVDKLCRTMFHDGKWDAKALARGLMYLTTLSLASCLYNYSDDDRREKYQNLMPWRKNMFWNFVIGDEVISIPKPFEAGMIFGSLPERFMDYLWGNDKRAFDGVAQALYSSLTPEFVPMAVTVMLELEANYSRFFGRNIVPMSEQRLDAELQYGPHTAEWAKQMTQITKYLPEFQGVPFFENFSKTLRSPRMLEYAALALTGSAGRDLSDIYNMGSRLFKGEARPSENPLVVMPGVRRIFADAKYGGRDQQAFRTEITELKNHLDSAAHLYKNGDYAALTPYRVRLLQLEPVIKYTNKILTDRNRGINAANRMIQRITTAPNMTAKQKREAIDQINAYVLAMSREGLMRVEEIKKYLRTDKM